MKKMEPFCFWKGDDLGALIEGKARRSVCVCVFSCLMLLCYVVLCYVFLLIIFAPFGEVHYYCDDHYTYTSPSWKFSLGPCLVISLVFFGCFRPKTAKFTCGVGLDI